MEQRISIGVGPARQLNRIRQAAGNSANIEGIRRGSGFSASSAGGPIRSFSTTWSTAAGLASSISRSVSQVFDTVRDARPSWADLLACNTEGTVDPRRPVTCLDQLYCQATALSPLLVKKVQEWAAASRGFFAAAEPASQGFLLWEDVRDEELRIGGCVRWARIKSAKRSIEKATRSYGKVHSNFLL